MSFRKSLRFDGVPKEVLTDILILIKYLNPLTFSVIQSLLLLNPVCYEVLIHFLENIEGVHPPHNFSVEQGSSVPPLKFFWGAFFLKKTLMVDGGINFFGQIYEGLLFYIGDK